MTITSPLELSVCQNYHQQVLIVKCVERVGRAKSDIYHCLVSFKTDVFLCNSSTVFPVSYFYYRPTYIQPAWSEPILTCTVKRHDACEPSDCIHVLCIAHSPHSRHAAGAHTAGYTVPQ